MADDREEFSGGDEEEEEDITLRNPVVVEKYKMAGQICNTALKAVVEAVKPGAKLLDLSVLGDETVVKETEKAFKKGKEMQKGLAMPCCISVNGDVCHYSPLEDDASPPLEIGDVVKIDLGCHIDGYIAVVAHTVVVTEEGAAGRIPAGEKADVVSAAAACAEGLTHCFRPGAKNHDITDLILQVAADFNCTPVEGVLSHEMKRYIIDGSEVVSGRKLAEQYVLDSELTEYQVWAVDVVFSSAPTNAEPIPDKPGKLRIPDKAGKLRVSEKRPLVFKRALDTSYRLKMKASREVFSELNKKFQTFPFSLRYLDPKKGRFCISECMKHDLVQPYPILESRREEVVAHFKTTVLITANSITPITGLPPQPCECDKKVVSEEAVEAFSRSLQLKKKRRGKKKKGKGGGGKDGVKSDEDDDEEGD
eukprot:TRINITY_DN20334_c0_g1_i1.p1 TRINITY_DN20334_c0_g1~~TRINITY_DN20334_c0_g1_i1.p1  ORF type:complete len:452 (+),score=181.82 TRINITY_DN20334_c0_g1_i1:96-1358(+)